MTRATCRCGQTLSISKGDPDRIVCPSCGARVRIRRPEGAGSGEGAAPPKSDGFLRFFCPCGRRLKVNAERPPTHGKCPDCGRVVPVPTTAAPVVAGPDDRTVDLSPAEATALERWSQEHRDRRKGAAVSAQSAPTTSIDHDVVGNVRVEVGLRICPQCGKPVHMGAANCRHCGAAVPRR
jgi:hypothetical protein